MPPLAGDMTTGTGQDLDDLLRRQTALLAEVQARLQQETTQRMRLETSLQASARRVPGRVRPCRSGQRGIGHSRTAHPPRQPEFCEITGYSSDELMAMTPSQITHPDDRPFDAEQYQRIVRGEIGDYSLEKRYLHKDGGIVWIQCTPPAFATPMGHPARVRGRRGHYPTKAG